MAEKVFLAHINEDGEEQEVWKHSRKTADYAAEAVFHAGLFYTAYLAGLLHDGGKLKGEYYIYLSDAASGKPVRRGSVNHTFAGVRFVLENWHRSCELGYAEITAELLAFAIGSHHGLFDCVNEKRESGFGYRQTKQGIGYEESIANFFVQCASRAELDDLFQRAVKELTPILDRISGLPQQRDDAAANSEILFYAGMLSRLLLSAVMEGDRRDTAEFMNHAVFPKFPGDMRPLWRKCLDRVERKLRKFPTEKSIDQARRFISDSCAAFAERPGGVYRLNVPTGGGKTLASLRYALTHAKRWNKSRIVFTSPLLSILEQNARVIREYVGDDSLILEHHSNLVEPEGTDEQLNRMELLTENWGSPIVITTLVQLLNTLFSGKSSAIRRFHALCNSVIVIDEVQTVPNQMLTLFNLAVNFLTEICGATVILCSATQPSLEILPHPLLPPPQDMVPRREAIWKVFKRTEIRDEGLWRLEELPRLVEDSLRETDSLLVVCNTKSEAASLFHGLSGMEALRFHLSAGMCVAHRRETLQALQAALVSSRTGGPKVVCVSTQVIEAGVDISFQRVIRLAAGMDSVIQSAGRCNRNAESDTPGIVSVVRCVNEKLTHLEDIQRGQKATCDLLDAYEKNPERFGYDLAGDEAIGYYYRCLYGGQATGAQDLPVGEHGTLFDLLAENQKYAEADGPQGSAFFLRQAFKLAGGLFRVFDQDTRDVLVPYGQGRVLREDLIAAGRDCGHRDYNRISELLKQAKPYTVSLYQYQLEALREKGALISLLDGGAYALADGFYEEETGFSLKNEMNGFWEVSH